jgi:aerobic-type carbon monoxide dehydrogenase small subunit (CoxS/CutS family)
MKLSFTINGSVRESEQPAERMVVDILAEELDIVTCRRGCVTGACGRCMILLDGMPMHACLVPAFRINGRSIRTVEGLLEEEDYRDIERSLSRAAIYPPPSWGGALVLAIYSLLQRDQSPDEAAIESVVRSISARGVPYAGVVRAVRWAAELKRRRMQRAH